MSGILKKVQYLESIAIEDMLHPINMYFVKDENDSEVYPYQTAIEDQFCSPAERKNGLLDDDAAEKLKTLKSCIGRKFDINLYKFPVSELTDGKYVALDDVDSYEDDTQIREFRRATFKSREDIAIQLKFNICLSGMDGRFVGITKDGDEEDIDYTLIFPPQQEEPKSYDIPYEGFPEITEYFILNEMPIENIEKGQYLAASLKYDKITQFDGSYLIRRFEEYRKKVREVNFRNSTLRKKIAFWEPQETVEPFDPTKGTIIECDRKTVLDFFKDSYILSKTYPKDCDKAKEDYYRKCEDDLRERFNYEAKGEKRVKDNNVKEVIIVLKPSIEGETTMQYIRKILSKYDVKISKIPIGIPMGTDIEYIDPMTLELAFEDRKNIV